MTDERDKAGRDKLVSETYRKLSAPKAPDHLNQSVLRMAASGEASTKGLLFAAWMKPVAWAATIALSLAIVIEYSEVPTRSVELDIVPVGESTRDEIAPINTDELKHVETRARSEIGSDQTSIRQDKPQAPTAAVLEEMMLEDASPIKSEAKSKTNTFSASSPAAARPAARKLATEQPAPDEANSGLLDSDQRALEGQAAAEPLAYLASSTEKKESDATTTCDAKARQSAEAWLECIDDLRESGAIEDADREYEAFILEYPAESAN